jgi:hypothetical protein
MLLVVTRKGLSVTDVVLLNGQCGGCLIRNGFHETLSPI